MLTRNLIYNMLTRNLPDKQQCAFCSGDAILEEQDYNAFWAFQVYLRLFNKQDSHIIKNETDRIMKMTQWAVRNNVLEALGI
jgi:hypothetical protein